LRALALSDARRYVRGSSGWSLTRKMLRIALIDILLFALPFILYGAYMYGVKGVAPGDLWQSAPIFWLLAAGCGLLLVVMATLIQFSGGKPGGTYSPPVYEDGVIKPGHID
jgi:hypothetical protein